MAFIELCIHCYKYERRLNWMLSSIIQQRAIPDLNVSITILDGAKTSPDIYSLAEYFRNKGLDINLMPLDRETFAKRGLARNKQISNSNSEWLFFGDADNIYHPDFFKTLEIKLKGSCKDVTKCITSIKKSHTYVEQTNEVLSTFEYPIEIIDVYDSVIVWPMIKKLNKRIAAGCMQVVNRQAIYDINSGYYTHPRKNRDWHMFNTGQRARSDIQFRRSMGGSTLIRLPTQIHLNHDRDKEHTKGTHLETQR